jgi:hypothetical protein
MYEPQQDSRTKNVLLQRQDSLLVLFVRNTNTGHYGCFRNGGHLLDCAFKPRSSEDLVNVCFCVNRM